MPWRRPGCAINRAECQSSLSRAMTSGGKHSRGPRSTSSGSTRNRLKTSSQNRPFTTQTSDFPGGMVMLTFTPIQGVTPLVLTFLPGGNVAVPTGGNVIFCEWDEVPHLSDQEKADLVNRIPAYQREARTKGIPCLGSGAIYRCPSRISAWTTSRYRSTGREDSVWIRVGTGRPRSGAHWTERRR